MIQFKFKQLLFITILISWISLFQLSALAADIPTAPSSLVATVSGDNKVGLSWVKSTSTLSITYSIRRSLTSGSGYTIIKTGLTSLEFYDTTVSKGVTYYYKVFAQNSSGISLDSNEAKIYVSVAKMLFKSNLASGVTLGSLYNISAHGAWQKLSGTDSETGYSWPIANLGSDFSGIQWILTDTVSSSTIGDYISTGIKSVVGPKGKMVNEISQNVKLKPVGMGYNQAPLLINRPWTIGDVTNLYTTFYYRHQANLTTQLTTSPIGGNWRVLYEFKTGGYNNSWPGDYRITIYVIKGNDGIPYWKIIGDNGANGPWPYEVYWTEENHTVPVPVDKWFKVEAYWHRSSGADGRYWAAINGKVIVNHYGNNMGVQKLPITRIFVTNPYSGGYATVETHMTGLEFWNGFPCGDSISCP